MSVEPKGLSLDEIIDKAKGVLIGFGKHKPMIIAVGTKGYIVQGIDNLPGAGDARHALLYKMGRDASREALGRLEYLYMIAEVWLSSDPEYMKGGKRPKDDPNRIELLHILQYQAKDRRVNLVMLKIERDEAGKIVDLPEHLDNRKQEDIRPESALLDHFMRGYNRALKGKLN